MQMNISLKDCWVAEWKKILKMKKKWKKKRLVWVIGFSQRCRLTFLAREIWEVSGDHSTALSSQVILRLILTIQQLWLWQTEEGILQSSVSWGAKRGKCQFMRSLEILRYYRSRWVGACNSHTIHGIFTDCSIFRIPFPLWKKGSSGPGM